MSNANYHYPFLNTTEYDIIVESHHEDDEFEFPQWALMICVLFLASFFAYLAFYISRKNEEHRRSTQKSGSIMDMDQQVLPDEIEEGLVVKQWQDLPPVDKKTNNTNNAGLDGTSITRTLSEGDESSTGDSSSDNTLGTTSKASTKDGGGGGAKQKEEDDNDGVNGTENNSAVMSAAGVGTRGSSVNEPIISSSSNNTRTTKNFQERLAVPRCVLCSKNFTVGDNVTCSNNPICDHGYHRDCLIKIWSKSTTYSGLCPVCKVTYVLEKQEATA